MFGIGGTEMFVLLILGVLLFGEKLPEVGRSLGKSLMEFKKSLQGLEDQFRSGVNFDDPAPTTYSPQAPRKISALAPKYSDTDPAQPGV